MARWEVQLLCENEQMMTVRKPESLQFRFQLPTAHLQLQQNLITATLSPFETLRSRKQDLEFEVEQYLLWNSKNGSP